MVEGTLHAPDDQPLALSAITVSGHAGFRAVFHTDRRGAFSLVLPYGRYRISDVTVDVVPLWTIHLELKAPAPLAGPLPGGFSLPSGLLLREATAISEPLDFTGLSDNRLGVVSFRGFPWTTTRFTFHGIDATDSYQPGRPVILPDMEAVTEPVVQASGDAALFLDEPSPSWRGSLSSYGAGSPFSSTNLPPPALRGAVRQPDRFHWFTRDRLQVGGPIGQRADLFASAAGQWASQTMPLTSSGDQRSRLLFANARGRVAATHRDQIDALYSGSRIDLSNGGWPAGLEALTGRRNAPSFILPGGFPNQSEVDHLDFLQAGWRRELAADSGLGSLEIRYGYSTAHLDTPSARRPFQSSIELVDGSVTGAPPLNNLAIRTRHAVAGSWRPGTLGLSGMRHQIAAGGTWMRSTASNRFTAPLNSELITAGGSPAFLVELNAPVDTRAVVHSFAGSAADHIELTRGLSVDAGVLMDLSRGSLVGRPASIAWNSLSPRAGFAWQVPHLRGLILRGAYARDYEPLSGRLLDFGNPDSLGGSVYRATDHILLERFGGPVSSISPTLRRPYADEFRAGAAIAILRRAFGSLELFRRDEKDRLAAINTGFAAEAFQPRTILDPGPDGIEGTFDDRPLTVYEQNPATFGQDRYLLANPPGLRMLNMGLVAQAGGEWRRLTIHASFVAEKSRGPTNPGNAVFENDPGVIGSLFLDPNSSINASGRIFTDRAYIGKLQSTYRLPGGIDVAAAAAYLDGLVFARRLLVTGLAQGPFVVATTVRGSPEGGNRAQYVLDWNLRFSREFARRFALEVDILNVTNA